MQKSLLPYQILIYFCLFSIRSAVIFEVFSDYWNFPLNQSTIFFSVLFFQWKYIVFVLSRMQNMFNYWRRNVVFLRKKWSNLLNISQVTVLFVHELSRWGKEENSLLPGGESNPGLPRDRRGYWPLYYRRFASRSQSSFIELRVKQLLSWLYSCSVELAHAWIFNERNCMCSPRIRYNSVFQLYTL